MEALGVSADLKEKGAANGDLIMVGEVDFRYFEETPMAARARLAGFTDSGGEGEEGEGEGEGELSVEEVMRRQREQQRLDDELADMLEDDNEITLY